MDAGQLSNWLCGVACKMQDQLQSKREDGEQTFVTKAIEYVRGNYGDQELTIDKICGLLGVSAAYFSTTFKKETGKTFINYLTDYRMEQAVQRLIEKDDKTYVIAAQVGYADPAYFSYVFVSKPDPPCIGDIGKAGHSGLRTRLLYRRRGSRCAAPKPCPLQSFHAAYESIDD